MLDFAPVRSKELTISQLANDLTRADLRDLTNEMVDAILVLIADATDEDVVFVPEDPEAYDSYASDEADVDLAWTLGHVIVHVTASAEEGGAIAAELARGVAYHGRSRSEVPWQTVTTIEQCRQRLEESRRMCLASFDMWPDRPHLDNSYQRRPGSQELNAVSYFVFSLSHSDSHLGQIADIVSQAMAAHKAA